MKQKEGISSFVIESATLVNAQQNINVVAYGWYRLVLFLFGVLQGFTNEKATLANETCIKFWILGVRDGLSGSTEFTIPIFGASSTLFPTLPPDSQATNGQPASQPQTQASYLESTITTSNIPFSSPTTTTNTLRDVSPPPSCNINPTVGDILSPFSITCTVAPSFCKAGPCMYCFRTSTGAKTFTQCSECSHHLPKQKILYYPLFDLCYRWLLVLWP